MRKQVITNKDEKLNIVILQDDATEITVKGIARCHDSDEYNEEVGLKLANTRAWLKYYEKLAKYNKNKLEYFQYFAKRIKKDIEQANYTLNLANVRAEEIKKEYEELLKTL